MISLDEPLQKIISGVRDKNGCVGGHLEFDVTDFSAEDRAGLQALCGRYNSKPFAGIEAYRLAIGHGYVSQVLSEGRTRILMPVLYHPGASGFDPGKQLGAARGPNGEFRPAPSKRSADFGVVVELFGRRGG